MVKSVALMHVSTLILRGKQENKSSTFLISELTNLGYQVEKVLVIGESAKIVTNELDTLSKHYDVVIVVGDAKNNIVLKALANLCCEETEYISDQIIDEIPSAIKKLSSGITHPVIYLQRIFLLREDFTEEQYLNILKPHLETYLAKRKFIKKVLLQKNGNTSCILEKLEKFASVQSYDTQDQLKVTIRDEKFERVVECEELLKKELGNNFLESYEENSVLKCVYESEDSHIRQALQNIEKCLETNGAENTFLSFNGGKDCTVLLHLVYTVLKIKYPSYKKPIFCLYVKSKEAFSEQDRFISQCQTFYNLDLISVTLGMKEALSQVMKRMPNLKACFMGTRKTDPYSANLNVFQMTDPDWPQIMRVSPLLEWHYSDIWDYLLFYKVPYCKLYDMGYTSLGNASNTIRNPSLSYYDVTLGAESYLPAFKMLNESKERSGRNVRL